MNAIDASPLTTIAAVHGVTFGGGFELALVCDLIIADKMARFCFPELRLGLIPGFGGIPRLKRDLGNAVVRDLLLTGRSFNATKAQQSDWSARWWGKAKHCERRAAPPRNSEIRSPHRKRGEEIHQADSLRGVAAGNRYLLRSVRAARRRSGLKKFVESKDAQPYLP